MKSHRISLLFSLLFLAINIPAQDFKVIKETDDYILKECDSVFYYTHGMEPKDDFVLDTTKIHKINGVLKLPLDNGKEVVFRDTIYSRDSLDVTSSIYSCKNFVLGYYLVHYWFYDWDRILLVKKSDGTIDTIDAPHLLSPSGLYYANPDSDRHPGMDYIEFTNLKTHKHVKVSMLLITSWSFHWINKNSFIFYTSYFKNLSEGLRPDKYYLVQIKQ